MASAHGMSSADAAWLHMDRPTNLMVITGALWFDEPVDWERVREVIATRLGRALSALSPAGRSRAGSRSRARTGRTTRLRPRPAPPPRWPCPRPATAPRCRSFVGDLMAPPLDRSRPLWHWYLVDGYGDGSAIVARMHHCIADGIALARVLLSLTDAPPDAGIAAGRRAEPRSGAGSAAVGALVRPAGALGSREALAGAVAHEAVEVARDPSELVDLAGGGPRRRRGARPSCSSRAPTRRPCSRASSGSPERVAWSEPIPLDEVKAVGHATGTTVNDVLLTAVAGALRSYLAARDSLVDELHAFVPFNLRPLDQPLPRRARQPLRARAACAPGRDRGRAGERLDEVHRRMEEIKHSPEGALAYGLLGALGTDPGAGRAAAPRAVLAQAGSAVMTNVPGPARAGLPRRHAGARRPGLGADAREASR